MFHDRGFEATTMRDIAAQAGVRCVRLRPLLGLALCGDR